MKLTREQAARVLAAATSLGFLGTAGLHGTGHDSVVRVAKDVPGVMAAVMPALWLAFSVDLTVLGLIIGVIAVRPGDVPRPILVIAGLCPFAAAGLQVRSIGFVPPTGLLITLGVLTWASAAVWPPHSSRARSGT